MTKLTEKVNELVDIINKQVKERPMFMKTPVDLLKQKEKKKVNPNIKAAEVKVSNKDVAKGKEAGATPQKRNTRLKRDKDDNAQNYNL